MSVRRTFGVLGAASLAVLATFAVPTAASAAREDLPDIGVTVAFDHPSYNGTASFILTFTFTNTGSAAAHDVQAVGGDVEGLHLNDLAPGHFDLAPGASHTGTATGTIEPGGFGSGVASFAVQYQSDEADANPANNTAVARTQVFGAFGDLEGVVYDKAGPLPPDSLGVACVTVVVTNVFAPGVMVARLTTDATGSFRQTHLPAGEYNIDLVLPTGYRSDIDLPTAVQVRSFGPTPMALPLIRTDGPVHCPPGTPTGGAAAPVLPTTGAAALRIGAAGMGALIVGVALVLVARRRRRTT